MQWVADQGRRLGLAVSPLYTLAGLLWGATEGVYFGVGLQTGFVLTALGLGLTAYFALLKKPSDRAPVTLLVWSVSLLLVAIMREVIRVASLERFGYRVADYPYILDWGSILIFAVTTIAGVSVVTYMVLVLYQSGGAKGDVENAVSPKVERFGSIATGMLGGWFAFFIVLGLYSTFYLK